MLLHVIYTSIKLIKNNKMKPKEKAFYAYNSTEVYTYMDTYTQTHDELKFKLISKYINKKTITIFKTSVVSPRLSVSVDEELSVSFPLVILSRKLSEWLKGKRENQIFKGKVKDSWTINRNYSVI